MSETQRLPCKKRLNMLIKMPEIRQCPQDLVKCLGFQLWSWKFINNFLTQQLEVLEWSVDNTFSCKRALLPSNVRDVGEGLVKQYGALFNYVWCIPKAEKRWQSGPTFFHIRSEGLFLVWVFSDRFDVWNKKLFLRFSYHIFLIETIFLDCKYVYFPIVSSCLINWSVSSGLPMHLVNSASNKLPRRFGESPSDVFLLIKGFVSDRELSQPPLIVWPGSKYQESLDSLYRIGQNQVNCD